MRALARLANGDIVAAGSFSSAGAVSAANAALWNGSSWSALGSGPGGVAYALAVRANGTLVAGGAFLDGNALPVQLTRWNGAAWLPFAGERAPFNAAFAIAELSATQLLVGGDSGQEGYEASGVALWSDLAEAWSPAVVGGFSGAVRAFATLAGQLVAAGDFESVGSVRVNRIAYFDGATWTGLGAGLNGTVHALAVLPSGVLVAGGAFTVAGSSAAAGIAAWNGRSWSALGTGVEGTVYALAVMSDQSLAVGGAFSGAGGLKIGNLARWTGSQWAATFGSGTNGTVLDLEPDGTGLLAAGSFTTVSGVAAPGIARWSPSPTPAWSALANSVSGAVAELAVHPSLGLIAAGAFTAIDGVPALSIARRPPSQPWQPLGVGLTSVLIQASVNDLRVRSNGELVVGGAFFQAAGVNANGIAAWTGSAWRSFGPGVPDSEVLAVAALPGDQLAVGGSFLRAGFGVSPRFARWAYAGGTDADGDGADDVCDNCPFVANAAQADSGGLWSSAADGVGDACQCGEVTGDGRVMDDDLLAVRQALSGSASSLVAPERCSVTGAIDATIPSSGLRSDCNAVDSAVLLRALAGFAPGLAQACESGAP